MQAIILAAGVGSRLGARTDDRPKCLVEVAGVPIVRRQVDSLRAAGVDEIVVVTGYRAEQIHDALRDDPVRFVHNERYESTNVLTSWQLGSERLRGEHFFLHGDTVFDPAFLDRLLGSDADAGILLTVDRHEVDEEAMKVVLDGDRVETITKKIPPGDADGEFTGVMLVRESALEPLKATARRLLERPGAASLFVEAAVQALIDERPGSVSWEDISGLPWSEIDFEEDLQRAHALFADR